MKCSFRTLKGTLLGSSLGLGLTSIAAAQDVAPADEEHLHPATPVAEGHATEVESEPSWADKLSIGAFVDAYVALRSDSNFQHNSNATPPPNGAGGFVNPGVVGAFGHDAYVQGSGFGLAFAGADVSYAGDEFGATISLRFGPAVNRFYGADQSQFGIQNITQAYLTWKPAAIKGLTLDLGQFYTLFGAEVAESWRNMNYSRGGLYYAMQPFWHTGLRANYAFTERFGVNAMVVNGVNSAFEGNKSPTLGVQLVTTPIDELFVALGYMGDLHPLDGDADGYATKNFENFFDLVATLTLGDFKVVTNADLNLYHLRSAGAKTKTENWWGVSVAPGYSFTSWFGAAARVEYLSDSANQAIAVGGGALAANGLTPGAYAGKQHVTTLTGTLDFKPVPNSTALVLRPEFRYELASKDNYLDHDNKASKHYWQAVLGAVVTSM